MRFEHRQHHREPAGLPTHHRPPRRAKRCRRDQSLNLDEQRPSALDPREHRRSRLAAPSRPARNKARVPAPRRARRWSSRKRPPRRSRRTGSWRLSAGETRALRRPRTRRPRRPCSTTRGPVQWRRGAAGPNAGTYVCTVPSGTYTMSNVSFNAPTNGSGDALPMTVTSQGTVNAPVNLGEALNLTASGYSPGGTSGGNGGNGQGLTITAQGALTLTAARGRSAPTSSASIRPSMAAAAPTIAEASRAITAGTAAAPSSPASSPPSPSPVLRPDHHQSAERDRRQRRRAVQRSPGARAAPWTHTPPTPAVPAGKPAAR